MKKKILFILSFVMVFVIGFTSALCISAYAEEPTTTIVEEEPTTEVALTESTEEETITITYQVHVFWEKFGNAIISGVSSVLGYAFIYLFTKKMQKKLQKKIEDSIDEHSEEGKKLSKAYEDATTMAELAKQELLEEKKLLETCMKQNEVLRDNFEAMKKLMAYLVASNDNLSSNGYAQKILELLNEEGESSEEEGNN